MHGARRCAAASSEKVPRESPVNLARAVMDAALSKVRMQDKPLRDARSRPPLGGTVRGPLKGGGFHLFVVKIGVTIKRLTIALLKLC